MVWNALLCAPHTCIWALRLGEFSVEIGIGNLFIHIIILNEAAWVHAFLHLHAFGWWFGVTWIAHGDCGPNAFMSRLLSYSMLCNAMAAIGAGRRMSDECANDRRQPEPTNNRQIIPVFIIYANIVNISVLIYTASIYSLVCVFSCGITSLAELDFAWNGTFNLFAVPFSPLVFNRRTNIILSIQCRYSDWHLPQSGNSLSPSRFHAFNIPLHLLNWSFIWVVSGNLTQSSMNGTWLRVLSISKELKGFNIVLFLFKINHFANRTQSSIASAMPLIYLGKYICHLAR